MRATLGVALALEAAAFGVGAACNSTGIGGPSPDSGAAEDANTVSPALCPNTSPVEGTACTLPEGTTCGYGQCGFFLVCTRGAFRGATSPRLEGRCPAQIPEQGAVCGPCLEDGGVCVYGDPTCADAQTNAALSTCSAGKFSVRSFVCEAGVDAAPRLDAPPGDAPLDAPEGG